jgi:hypothetical protein
LLGAHGSLEGYWTGGLLLIHKCTPMHKMKLIKEGCSLAGSTWQLGRILDRGLASNTCVPRILFTDNFSSTEIHFLSFLDSCTNVHPPCCKDCP